MPSNDVIAKSNSVALGGDNAGNIVNVHAEKNSVVNVHVAHAIERRLPSHLGHVISAFAEQRLSDYAGERSNELPPEVAQKLAFNDISGHRLVSDYVKYVGILEKAYRGAEQRNSDARVLVRRKAGIAYAEILGAVCSAANISQDDRQSYARKNSIVLAFRVIERLMNDYGASQSDVVEEEAAHLAVSLVVTDAICDCEVLERPVNATAA